MAATTICYTGYHTHTHTHTHTHYIIIQVNEKFFKLQGGDIGMV